MATAVLAAAALPSGTSAAGTLALLEEDDDSLKVHALQLLDKSVHDFWFQIASSIASIEALYEDEEFSHRELAALVVSKVRGRDSQVLGSWSSGEQSDRRRTCGCHRTRRSCSLVRVAPRPFWHARQSQSVPGLRLICLGALGPGAVGSFQAAQDTLSYHQMCRNLSRLSCFYPPAHASAGVLPPWRSRRCPRVCSRCRQPL